MLLDNTFARKKQQALKYYQKLQVLESLLMTVIETYTVLSGHRRTGQNWDNCSLLAGGNSKIIWVTNSQV